jgi:hypothetical protein
MKTPARALIAAAAAALAATAAPVAQAAPTETAPAESAPTGTAPTGTPTDTATTETAPNDASTTRSGPDHRACFLSNNWESWKVAPGGDALYLRIRLNNYFRVGLAPGTRAVRTPGSFLVNRVRGSNWICSPLDLDLTISDTTGIRQPLIARSLHQLTPEEVAAIPRKDLP